jgi:hypothetical protein
MNRSASRTSLLCLFEQRLDQAGVFAFGLIGACDACRVDGVPERFAAGFAGLAGVLALALTGGLNAWRFQLKLLLVDGFLILNQFQEEVSRIFFGCDPF